MADNVLEQAVKGWARTAPARTTELSSDKAGFGHFWLRSAELLARLPAKPKRNADEAAAAAEVLALARDARTRFMRAHARGVYDTLTAKRSVFLRVDELCARAATEYPGLLPGAKEMERDSGMPQKVMATAGQLQQNLPTGRTFQLLRLRIDPALGLVPEISGNRLMVSVRLMHEEAGDRLQPSADNATFELTLCS